MDTSILSSRESVLQKGFRKITHIRIREDIYLKLSDLDVDEAKGEQPIAHLKTGEIYPAIWVVRGILHGLLTEGKVEPFYPEENKDRNV